MTEAPFEYLRRLSDGNHFGPETVKLWYEARAYVLDKLKNISFTADSKQHLHAVVSSDSPAMLSVVRQIALSAHYINHREEDDHLSDRCRTLITIVSRRNDIKELLAREEYLNGLVNVCKFTDSRGETVNYDSYIDLEIRIETDSDAVDTAGASAVRRDFSDTEMKEFCDDRTAKGEDIYRIDTRDAFYSSRIYMLGVNIDNLPNEDIHSADRYVLALDTFKYRHMPKVAEAVMTSDDPIIAREQISNIFCADCFNSRAAAIEKSRKTGDKKTEDVWKRNNQPLSWSEHSRWIAEKFIMGYRPLSAHEHYRDESLFYDRDAQNRYRKMLKRSYPSPAHIDLCPYRDLRRINPGDLKYDSFMMLAIPHILANSRK